MVVTMEKSNSAINGSRLKNVAKKSTTRLPGDVMKMRDYSIEASPVSPSTTSNKNSVDRISIFEKITMGMNGQNRSVTDGAHKNGVLSSSGKKRLAEAEDDSGSNPAKFARTQIEEIERRHEEMLNTAMSGGVNDADLTVVRDRSAHSNGDKCKTSSEADSSMDVEVIGDNQGSRSLFSLAEKMKDSLKGVIKTAATNIVDRQQPYCISDGEDSEAVSSTSRTEKPAMSVDKVNLFESFSGLAQKVIKQKDNFPEVATLSKDGVHNEVTRAPDIDKSRKADSSGDEDPSFSVEFLASPVPGNGSVEPSLAAKEANDSVRAKAAHGTPCHVESVQVNGADGTEYSVGTKPASENDSTEYSVGISACGQNVTESAVGSVYPYGTDGTECSESTIPANGTDGTEFSESTIPDNGTDGTQCFESFPANGTDGTQCFESFPDNGTDGTQCFESTVPVNGSDGTQCSVASPSVNGTVDTKHPSSPIRAECQSSGDNGTMCSLTNETDGKIKPENVTDNILSSVNSAEEAGIEYKDDPVPCGADAALDSGGESEEVDEDLLLGNQDGGGDCQDSVNDDILDVDDTIQSSDDASTPKQLAGQNTDLLGAASVNSHSSQDVFADKPCGSLLSKADTTDDVADDGHVKDSCNQVITLTKMTSDKSEDRKEDNEGEKEYEKSGVDDVRDTYPSEKTLKARVTDPSNCSNESVEPECETSVQLCSSVRHIDGIQCEESKEASDSDVDMKTDDKCSLIGDYKSVVSHVETDEDTRSMVSSHKRHGSESHTDEEDVGDGKNEAKKTRLDAVIRQLGTHLKSQSDDALDPLSRDMDDGAGDSDHHGTDQIISIRMKDLEKVILRRMTQYMETNHGSLISSLQRRVADLSSVAQLWQKRAEDLKSKLTAAKILKNSKVVRNMGIQVTEKKVEAAAGGYVKTTTTRRPSSSTPATPSPVNQTLLGTVVNPVASGTVLAPAPNLSLAGGTITLLPHPTQTSSSSPSTRSVKSGSTPVTVPCLTGVIDLTEEEDKKPGQKTAVTSMPSVAAALCSPPAAGALAQTTGGALLVQQPGGAPLLLQPMAGMTSTAGPLLYTSHPTSFMVQTPATTTSSVLRNPLPISTTLQQQYVVAGSAMTKPPTAAAITTPSTQGQLNQPKPRPAATNQRSIVASAPRIVPKQICQPKPINKPSSQHPAPLPDMPTNATNAAWKKDPPKPGLKISRVKQGIVLSWNMALTDENAAVVNYQLFAYQETAAPPASNLWKKVGNVKALPLPMACTLTQFQEGNKYHFSVRAIDAHGRMGPFSEPGSIHLKGAVS